MNANDVNRTIRSVVRPILKDQGFTVFTARTAWRHHGHAVDVINFQSFNRYLADTIECSTFSYAVNLGIFLTSVRVARDVPVRSGVLCPAEYACHIRRKVESTLPTVPKHPDIWLIDETGDNVEQTVQGTAFALIETAMPWFDALRDPATVLAMLQDSLPPPDPSTWLPGALDSPARNVATGYLAEALGELSLAESYLRRALAQYRDWDARRSRARGDRSSTVPADLERTVARYDEQRTQDSRRLGPDEFD